jgi:hypothetical protein
MYSFKAKRVVHEYVQTNPAPAEKLFPLLCPVREAEWLPGWEYRLIYSESGLAFGHRTRKHGAPCCIVNSRLRKSSDLWGACHTCGTISRLGTLSPLQR